MLFATPLWFRPEHTLHPFLLAKHALSRRFAFVSSSGEDVATHSIKTVVGVSFSGKAADFPTPLEVVGEPGTYVGRVRVEGNVISYWCVADNLLKGAATNAVQIAESLASVRV